jgi:glycosyltransferase involved in cell wall biosynthesis
MTDNIKKIGIGITTYNRPEYFKQCFDSLIKNIQSADVLIVYNDGSSVDYSTVLAQIADYGEVPFEQVVFIDEKVNRGVAHAKNTLLARLLEAGCDHLFLLEDDILLLDDRAVTEYIRVATDYGYHHMMFAHHGKANEGQEHYQDKELAYWPHCIGAWCYYTRECLEGLAAIEKEKGMDYPGLFDENFINAWEHVEHSTRLGNAGFTAWFGLFPDLVRSKEYITEIEGSIDGSSIRNDSVWRDRMKKGLEYWKTKHGSEFPGEITINTDAPRQMEGEGAPA